MKSLPRTIGLLVAALLIVGAMVVPTIATAATGYFSHVTTVKVAITEENHAWMESDWITAWCPVGYRVTGGGFDFINSGDTLYGSTPTSNSAGRQGWRIGAIAGMYGNSGTVAYVYAQCIE
jgi:hypothetical protein